MTTQVKRDGSDDPHRRKTEPKESYPRHPMNTVQTNLLEELGERFRNLCLHSDGRWTASCGKEWAAMHGVPKFLVNAPTAQECLQKLLNRVKEVENPR